MAAADVSGKSGVPQPTYEPISAPGQSCFVYEKYYH